MIVRTPCKPQQQMKKPDATSASVSSTITNMILWMFVPGAITNFLLKRYYSFKYSRNSPNIPKPNSPKFKRHYKICYTFVIGLYFIYCVAQSIYSLEPSYYSAIGVSRSRVRTDLRKRSRQLLLTYHPDKAGNTKGDMNRYLELKSMIDVIENENTCNIYEKFGRAGIDAIGQTSQKKHYANRFEIRKDYIFAAMIDSAVFYAGIIFTLLVVGMTSKNQAGQYWRFVGLAFLAAYETYLYFVDFTSLETIGKEAQFSWTNPLSWISFLLSFVPIHQRIKMLRQVYIYSGFAVSQLGPLWFPNPESPFKDPKVMLKELQNIQKMTSTELMQETTFAFNDAFEPFKENEEMKTLLKREMGRVALDLRVLESMKEGGELKKHN